MVFGLVHDARSSPYAADIGVVSTRRCHRRRVSGVTRPRVPAFHLRRRSRVPVGRGEANCVYCDGGVDHLSTVVGERVANVTAIGSQLAEHDLEYLRYVEQGGGSCRVRNRQKRLQHNQHCPVPEMLGSRSRPPSQASIQVGQTAGHDKKCGGLPGHPAPPCPPLVSACAAEAV